MASFNMRGLDEYMRRLEALKDDTSKEVEAAVMAGADIVADAIRTSLTTIPTHPEGTYGTQKNPERGLTPREKADVLSHFGLAPIRDEGTNINTKAGFAGVSSTKTKKYPGGVPITTLVRRIESGTSWIEKTPVIRPAVNRSKTAALEAMQKELEKQIEQLMS